MKTFASIPSHRIGKWVVLVIWLIVAGWAFSTSSLLTGVENNNATSFLPDNAESTQVYQILASQPGANATPAIIVYVRDSGITAADTAKAKADAADIKATGIVTGNMLGPDLSQDKKALLTSIPLAFQAGSGLSDDIKTIDSIAGNYNAADPSESGHATVNGVDIWTTGPAAQAADLLLVAGDVDSTLLLVSVAVVIFMLLLTYRSPSLWFFPLVSVGVALALAQSVNYILATQFGLTVNFASASLLLVLVFGAGTDYALLVTARYREELRGTEDKHEAMAKALAGAGPAILASGATVSIGMLCLLVSQLETDKGLGPVAAVGIICALACMLTLYPAMLTICGRWIFWPKRPDYGKEYHQEGGAFYKVGHLIAKRPRVTWMACLLILAALACLNIPYLNASGLSNAQSFTKPIVSVEGQTQVANHYPAGSLSPIYILGLPDITETAGAIAQVVQSSNMEVIAKPTSIQGYVEVVAATKGTPDGPAAQRAIAALRTNLNNLPFGEFVVGGAMASQLDSSTATDDDRSNVIPLVLLVVFIVIAILLRALLGPFVLMLVGMLSWLASMGLSVAIFNIVFDQPAQDNSYPLYVFIFLVALGVDYNIFLMHRVKEEAPDLGTKGAILESLSATGGVITSAGLVLAFTFATLAVLPITTTFQLGLTVAFGVLIDTFFVRSIFFPGLALDMGWRMWIPGAQARIDRDRLAAAPEVPGSPPVPERVPVDSPSG